MRNTLIAVLVTASFLAGCVGGTTKLRYTEMPDLSGAPLTSGVAMLDVELGLKGYKPNPADGPYTTRCSIVKEGAEDSTIETTHNYGFFVFENLEPGRYCITRMVWNATIWITDTRDADERAAAGQTADEVPHDCKFTYTFEPWKTPGLTFVVEPGAVTYHGVISLNESAEFELVHGVRPPGSMLREGYGDHISLSTTVSYEKRALEELHLKNENNEWGKVIQARIKKIEETTR